MPNPLSARFMGSLAIASVFLVGAVSTAAAAQDVVVSQPYQVVRTMHVKVADLDMSRASDRKTLDMRIEKAARRVCDVNRGSLLDHLPDARDCLTNARSGAMAQLAGNARAATLAVSARVG